MALDLDNLPDVLDLGDEALLVHLADVGADLRAAEARVKVLRERRIAIYENARNRQPQITQTRLAAAAQVTEVAVIQALRRADDARAKASASS